MATIGCPGDLPDPLDSCQTYESLPWIDKRPPPLSCCFPPNDLFHYSFTIKQNRTLLNSGQDFINLTRDTSCSSWGSSWGSSIFSQSETPQKVISCIRKILIKRNIFWASETQSTFGPPQDHPQDDSKLYCFLFCLLIYPGISKFWFINFGGPGTLLTEGVY